MIVFLGDTHAQFEWIPNILNNVPEDATIIQVGDFGFYPTYQSLWERMWKLTGRKNPIYAIDGNHEYFPLFAGITKPTEIWEGVIYVPRATVMEIDGMQVGFMGGAASPDFRIRTLGVDWFLDEAITQDEFDKMMKIDYLDLMVTHTAPQCVVSAYFRHPSLMFPEWRLPNDWQDPSASKVEELWRKFGEPPLVCGHFHKHIVYRTVRILDINEIWEFRKSETD